MKDIKSYMLSEDDKRLICLLAAYKTTNENDLTDNLTTMMDFYLKATERFRKIEAEEFLPQSPL